jgi:transglutaminase-like putative cysteine protease
MARGDLRGRRTTSIGAALGVELALIAALLPSLRVIQPGPWLPGGLLLAALVLGVGMLARRLRWPAAAVAGLEVLVWLGALTVVFFRGSAWLGVIPTPAVADFAVALVRQTLQEMAMGVPPLTATLPVSFFFVAATGALAVVLDYVVIATRLPLLASVAVLAVGLAPSVAVPGRIDVWQVLLLAVSILFLLWTDTRTRPRTDRRVWSGSSAGALAVGAVAVVVALVVTPLLPAPDQRLTAGRGGSVGIDPSLRFGDDLRRPDPVDVLTVRSSTGGAPYLRAATLSRFDGDQWRPDSSSIDPIDAGFDPVNVAADIPLTDVETHVEIDRLRSGYLPVPFAATQVQGLGGEWGLQQENRTVVALGADASGQTYEVTSMVAKPSLEQIRAATSRDAAVDARYREVPADTPPTIEALAREVTANATTDYDAAADLQQWFRSSAFSYSLDAPVSDDFDGAGVQAIEEFLRVREGYCVHYAAAYALMARTLGMPTRIVVGYLPGTATGETVDGDPVYTVTSHLLHSWPEVYFDDIGWVRFEPTNSLGAPPRFTPTGSSASDDVADATVAPTAAPTSSATPSRAAEDIPSDAPSGTVTAGGAGQGGVIVGIIVLVVAVLLALPGAVGVARRRRRVRDGDAAASWLLVQETAIDLGIPAPASDSPRAFGARLREAGAPSDDVARLVHAVERAAYAPAGAAERAPAGAAETSRDAADAAASVRSAVLAAAPPAHRMRALLMPRSLLVRPGTAAAGAGE